jgi:hypothetical protein
MEGCLSTMISKTVDFSAKIKDNKENEVMI